MRREKIEGPLAIVLVVVIVFVVMFSLILAVRKERTLREKKIYNAGFVAGQAVAEKAAATEYKKGRIYKIVEISFDFKDFRDAEIQAVNMDKYEIIKRDLGMIALHDKELFNQFRKSSYVIMGENRNLVPLPSYREPKRIGG